MKLLFDANLSPVLVQSLSDLFPGSVHVQDFGALTAEDPDIMKFARSQGFTIVTKDADFNEMSQTAPTSPYIVWIRRGNCSTEIIEHILRSNLRNILSLENSDERTILVLA